MTPKNEVVRPAPQPVVAKIEVALFENGQIGINGPINDKLLAYGLLELAKDAVREHHQKLIREQARNIVIAKPIG